jgi:hypothetical protein
MTKMNRHWGTTLDEFLGAEGIREAAKAEAVTRAVAWQLTDARRPRAGGPHPEGQGQHDD